jgi:hypothetical protein
MKSYNRNSRTHAFYPTHEAGSDRPRVFDARRIKLTGYIVRMLTDFLKYMIRSFIEPY